MKKKLIIIVSTIIVLIFLVIFVKNNISNNLNILSKMKINDVDLSTINDGKYSGQYATFPVAVEVIVDIKNHKITAIDLIKHDNGKGKPAEAIIEDVVEKQTLDVDCIAGATYSSKVILKAIENALSNQ